MVALELYLTAIPDAVRQSLKRPADPTGQTVPAGFLLSTADDALRLLPPRPPRFRPGGPLPGKPGWELVKLLGVGGFGEVWLARHPRLASLSGAVKFCLGDTGAELIHEAGLIDRVMGAGRHPGLVPLTDCHLDGDAPWLMFEYVAGGSLTDWIHALAGKPPAERVKLVRGALAQLAGAVAHFHALTPPVVHRDLKPSNILLDRSTGRLRVTDFGIGSVTARQTLRLEGRGQTSRGGMLLTGLRGSHTPLYSSPQQRQGADPDPRDDVHALGVIGYQMLTGHLAQGAGPDFADDLREAGADDGLVGLLGRCVASKPDRRPADAGELVAALNKPAVAAVPTRKAGDRLELELPGGLRMQFAWCPPGTFRMGGTHQDDEQPVHEVTLTKGFYMGVYPVTQAELRAITGNDPSHFKGDRRPVEQVTWIDAVSFCVDFVNRTGVGISLPTEAMWEYACRAGTEAEYWWGDVPDTARMNYKGELVWNGSRVGLDRQQTTEVGPFRRTLGDL